MKEVFRCGTPGASASISLLLNGVSLPSPAAIVFAFRYPTYQPYCGTMFCGRSPSGGERIRAAARLAFFRERYREPDVAAPGTKQSGTPTAGRCPSAPMTATREGGARPFEALIFMDRHVAAVGNRSLCHVPAALLSRPTPVRLIGATPRLLGAAGVPSGRNKELVKRGRAS